VYYFFDSSTGMLASEKAGNKAFFRSIITKLKEIIR
jgi:hypothetical protein